MRGLRVVKPVSAIVRELNADRHLTPARVLVLYRIGDSVGQRIAEYYRTARGIPVDNVIACSFTWAPSSETITTAAFLPVLQTIEPHLISKDILAIVTCHWWPGNNSTHPIGDVLGFPHANLRGVPPTWLRTQESWFDDYPDGYRVGPLNHRGGGLYKPYPYQALPPVNRYQTHGNATGYVHFRLEVSPSPAGDEYARTIRMIDDAIAAENAEMSNFGKTVFSGSSVYPVVTAAYVDLMQTGAPYTACYKQAMQTETNPWEASQDWSGLSPTHIWAKPIVGNDYIYKGYTYTTGITGAVEPTWPTTIGATVVDGGITWKCMFSIANSFPAGDNALTPNYGTFTPANYTDVFLHFVGNQAYYGNGVQPQALTDFTYRRGAIAGWGMSYSAMPLPTAAIDWDSGSRTLGNITAVNAKAVRAGIPCTNENGISNSRLYCQYNGAAAAATITISANTLTFLENAVPVGSVALSGTLRNMMAQITAALPASWVTGAVDGYSESRTQQSIRAGACIAIGSCIEPYTTAAFKSENIVANLWLGEAIGEIAFKLWMPMLAYSQSLFGGMTIYGDPLYRPFGHRRT